MPSRAGHAVATRNRDLLRAAASSLDAAGVEDAALEADLLLAHALGVTRAQLYSRLADAPAIEHQAAFESLLARRLVREPLPYVTGQREFYGIDLLCAPAALIPRPETELLVELARDWIGRSSVSAPTVIDVGTGSGAIAIAVAAHVTSARIVATDVSPGSLALAVQNARRAGVRERIEFVHGSLLAPIRTVDLVVANLPYISDGVYTSLAPELRHEPEVALRAGPRGTELIEALLDQARDVLAPGGLLVAEHAWDQGESLRASARALFPEATVETKRDLAGLDRALVLHR